MVGEKENLPVWDLSWGMNYVSVTLPENLPEIKKALLKRLLKEPELISNKDLQKKVREYLSQ